MKLSDLGKAAKLKDALKYHITQRDKLKSWEKSDTQSSLFCRMEGMEYHDRIDIPIYTLLEIVNMNVHKTEQELKLLGVELNDT